ncbi:putative short chain dehydrogenase/reductase [Viridothelium virens]|uniref:Putative short chain dehydrogenase/reductase n=1 Tax=Viridothelium virens TaxID=1048519 RepID=A0A6A6HEX4_VIRVR|nr:putative short chain dehydrogenase/reductase [Viridothelium virens]
MNSPQTIILITGANTGIGYECAANILQSSSDYHVIIGSRDRTRGESAVTALRALAGVRGSVSTVQLDVTNDASVAIAASQIEAEHARLDILVHNAGIVSKRSTARDTLRETLATNTIGPVVVTELFTALLKRSKDPRVIFVTSSLGSLTCASDPESRYYKTVTGNQVTEYRASKAAMNMLMIQYGKERGFKTWSADPGPNITGLMGPAAEDQREKARKMGVPTPDVGGSVIAAVVKGERDDQMGKIVGRYEGVGLW